MVKNKSKNKKTLSKFGRVKNNKQQLLFPISVSHRLSHGYIPGAMYSNTEDLSIRLSTAWQYDPPPELLQRDRLPQNEVGLLLS